MAGARGAEEQGEHGSWGEAGEGDGAPRAERGEPVSIANFELPATSPGVRECWEK